MQAGTVVFHRAGFHGHCVRACCRALHEQALADGHHAGRSIDHRTIAHVGQNVATVDGFCGLVIGFFSFVAFLAGGGGGDFHAVEHHFVFAAAFGVLNAAV